MFCIHVFLIDKNHVNLSFGLLLFFFFSIKLYLLVHKMALVHRGQGETKERDSHSRVVGGRFHKQRNLHMRLILGCHKTRRSPHPPARILKVDIETLPGFSSVYRADDLSNTWLSRGCVLENDSHCGNTTHALQGQGRR